MDAITRKLRESGRLPKGGRGVHAPQIGPLETAVILVALAGSTKGLEADARIEKLEALRSNSPKRSGLPLLQAVEELLIDPSGLKDIDQVRVARTARRAAILFKDGTAEEFLPARPRDQDDRFCVEGVLPATLLQKIANAMNLAPTAKLSGGDGKRP
jgi:hypothetical protein